MVAFNGCYLSCGSTSVSRTVDERAGVIHRFGKARGRFLWMDGVQMLEGFSVNSLEAQWFLNRCFRWSGCSRMLTFCDFLGK